ncbi:hypothetical protein HMPREF9020_01539 [Scardovia inopinata F0304]|uniref:Transposase IS30-like HTH domain-containing protein n=1 Tax=Scardovia inopinata F0304 TaxID=641146 RepID=W1MXI0_SCAIO|nr:hypothetical protein HMPREF9020_01539 [Scardovia inopinata F0304]
MRFLIRKDSVTHMAYHHLTLHELVMVETYWSMRVPVSWIAQRMRRGRQTIYRVIHAFDRGMTALEYYHEYKKHRYHCGRKRVRLRAQYVHLITCFLHQGLSFDVISGLFPPYVALLVTYPVSFSPHRRLPQAESAMERQAS